MTLQRINKAQVSGADQIEACKPVFTLSTCPVCVGLKPTGFLHHNQIFDVITEKSDYNIKVCL